jgi:O-antigen ligase
MKNLELTPLKLITFFCVLIFPITYLSIRGSVHIPLIIVVLLSISFSTFNRQRNFKHIQNNEFDSKWVTWALSSLFIAVGISQIIRGDLNLSAFDGPSKLLLAALAIPFFKKIDLSYSRILEIGIGLGLFLLLMVLFFNPETSAAWGGRFATKFVDPNSLGSQTTILACICLLTISTSSSTALTIFKLLSACIGLYLSINAGSRGGWLTAPFLLLLFFALQWEYIKNNSTTQQKILASIGIISFSYVTFLAIDNLLPNFSNRLISGYQEVTNWFSGRDLNGSAGIRLSMWKVAILLSQDSLIAGFGETNMSHLFNGHTLNIPIHAQAIQEMIEAGPHSDLLSKLLSMGLIGLTAYLATIFIPWIFFWRNRSNQNTSIRLSSHIGLYLITGFFISGLANEMLSLKYLCSFYGLMIAVLVASIASKK